MMRLIQVLSGQHSGSRKLKKTKQPPFLVEQYINIQYGQQVSKSLKKTQNTCS